jgi:hypothetical protein
LLVVVGDGFGVRRRLMTMVACGGVQRCAAVRINPLVVVRQAVEEDEETEIAIYCYIIRIRVLWYLFRVLTYHTHITTL